MLDLKYIRDNLESVKQAVSSRHDSAPLDEIIRLDSERRGKVSELEEYRRKRKEAARERKQDEASIEEGRNLRNVINNLEEEVRNLDERLGELLLQRSVIPSFSPSSQCGRGWKSSFRGSPHARTNGLSSSPLPKGVDS